jgi:DNA-binding transcriptional regulator GbsR (MarR family)
MTHLSRAEEALIVEALGQAARLVEGVEELTRSVEATCVAMDNAVARLQVDLGSFSSEVELAMNQAEADALAQVRTQAHMGARDTMFSQAESMASAAQQLFSEQTHNDISQVLELSRKVLQRVERPWKGRLTHAATAVASALISMWCIYTWYMF